MNPDYDKMCKFIENNQETFEEYKNKLEKEFDKKVELNYFDCFRGSDKLISQMVRIKVKEKDSEENGKTEFIYQFFLDKGTTTFIYYEILINFINKKHDFNHGEIIDLETAEIKKHTSLTFLQKVKFCKIFNF